MAALAGMEASAWYAFAALVPPLFFWGLDAYYLALERRFRHLYELVDLEAPLPPSQKTVRPYWLNPTSAPKAAG
jgi:hypothetical protein